jgi:hypothetical protein
MDIRASECLNEEKHVTRRLSIGNSGAKSGKHKGKPARRTPLTRTDLLPLPLAQVRALSLEYHIALAAIRSQHGTVEMVTSLLRVLYLTYMIGKREHTGDETAALVEAERIMSCCIDRAVDGESGSWYLDETESSAIERVLAMHDAQLQNLPKHRYAEAWWTVQDTLSRSESPIPASSFV